MACPCLWHTMARLHHPASWRSLLVNVAANWVGVPQMPVVAGLHKHLAQLIANATLETTAKMSWLYSRICLTTATLMLNSFHTSSNTVCVSWNVFPLRCLGIWYCYPYGSWLKSGTALYYISTVILASDWLHPIIIFRVVLGCALFQCCVSICYVYWHH